MSPMMKTRATCLSQSAACATLTRAWYSILGDLKILGPAIHKNLFSAACFAPASGSRTLPGDRAQALTA